MGIQSYDVKEVKEKEKMKLITTELKKEFPDTLFIHGAIDMQLRYGTLKEPGMKIYQAQDPIFRSFIFVSSVASGRKFKQITTHWNTNEIEDTDIVNLFNSVPGWNWSLPISGCFTSPNIKLKFDCIVEKELKTRGISFYRPVEIEDDQARVLCLSTKSKNIPELPTGYVLKRLRPEDAHTLLSHWHYSFLDSIEGMQERLSTFEALGVFRIAKNGEKEDKLVAWIQQNMTGLLGLTYTIPEERRKGFGSVVTLTIANKIIKEGRTVFLFVESHNSHGLVFHQDIGFQIVGSSGWSIYLPTGKSMEMFNS